MFSIILFFQNQTPVLKRLGKIRENGTVALLSYRGVSFASFLKQLINHPKKGMADGSGFA